MMNQTFKEPDTPDHAFGPPHRILLGVLALSLVVRMLLAITVPLGVDEAYAIAVAREFSWAFFDHPPLGFWSPIISATLSGAENPFVYRLPTLIYGVFTTVLIYGIARQLGGPRAGLWAAILTCVSPAFIFSGVFVLPDGPLSLGTSFAVYWLVRIAKLSEPAPIRFWALAGVGLAIALASKYQAGLLPISVLAFMILSPVGRRWFLHPGPYIAALIGAIGLAPVVLWNIGHDWASIAFHTGRVSAAISPLNLAFMATGQLFYLLPPIFVFAVLGLWRGLCSRRPEMLLVALIALGPIGVFNIVFLFSNESFPHWTLPGWLFALPLAAVWLTQLEQPAWRRAHRYLNGFAGGAFVLLLVVVLHLHFGIVTQWNSEPLPDWDDTSKSFDYSVLYDDIQNIDEWQDTKLIATTHWIKAGLISTAFQGERPMKVLGRNKHHFAFMQVQNETGPGLLLDIVRMENRDKKLARLLARARKIDPLAQALTPIVLQRGSRPYLVVHVVALNFP